MRSVATKRLCLATGLFFAVQGVDAQDPRIGLKPGFRDAGTAARNMELVKSLPKPDGFFDPKAPAGIPTPPERDPSAPAAAQQPADPSSVPPAATPAPPPAPNPGLNFANSDVAFSRDHLFIGNFNGFNTYSIEDAAKARLLASVVCPGGQGDVSIHGNLLFLSVEQTRGRLDCGTQGVQTPVSAERFRGVRVFDISDMSKPRQVAAVQTLPGMKHATPVTQPK